jgi:hypothetical protein
MGSLAGTLFIVSLVLPPAAVVAGIVLLLLPAHQRPLRAVGVHR